VVITETPVMKKSITPTIILIIAGIVIIAALAVGIGIAKKRRN
jgi:LPXTG-motif cell wall-anchored protein